MTKRIKLLDEHSDYDIYDVQIDFKYTGNSFLNPDKYRNQVQIIIDRLQPDGIYSGSGSIAFYFNDSYTLFFSLGILNDSYWKQRTPDFKLINYSDYENNIYINSFDKPYAGINS